MSTKPKNVTEKGTGWKEVSLFGSYQAEEKAITKLFVSRCRSPRLQPDSDNCFE